MKSFDRPRSEERVRQSNRVRWLCSLLLSLVSACFSSAALCGAQTYQDWAFVGRITAGEPPRMGMVYSMTYTIDSSLVGSGIEGLYFPVVGINFLIPESYSGSGLPPYPGIGWGAGMRYGGVLVVNDRPDSGGGSFDGLMFGENDSPGFPGQLKWGGSDLGISLTSRSEDNLAVPFSSAEFPDTLDLNDFSVRSMRTSWGGFAGTVDQLYIDGRLVSEVPEPSSLAVLGIGTIVALFSKRRAHCLEAAPNAWSAADAGLAHSIHSGCLLSRAADSER